MTHTTAKSFPIHHEAERCATSSSLLWASSAAALLAYAARRKGAVGMLAATAGGSLLYRAASVARKSRNQDQGPAYGKGKMVQESRIIAKPASELYALWRDFENLPAFMRNVEAVRSIDSRRSHWTVRGPIGARLEWDAEVIADRKDELIGWRTLEGERVAHAGSVRFVPTEHEPDETEVTVTFQFNPPAGGAGAAVALLLGTNPRKQVREDLERFKAFAESMDLRILERLAEQRAWTGAKED
jgi:uncharacterized membrane protein